jgi:hypothetical protein
MGGRKEDKQEGKERKGKKQKNKLLKQILYHYVTWCHRELFE